MIERLYVGGLLLGPVKLVNIQTIKKVSQSYLAAIVV